MYLLIERGGKCRVVSMSAVEARYHVESCCLEHLLHKFGPFCSSNQLVTANMLYITSVSRSTASTFMASSTQHSKLV